MPRYNTRRRSWVSWQMAAHALGNSPPRNMKPYPPNSNAFAEWPGFPAAALKALWASSSMPHALPPRPRRFSHLYFWPCGTPQHQTNSPRAPKLISPPHSMISASSCSPSIPDQHMSKNSSASPQLRLAWPTPLASGWAACGSPLVSPAQSSSGSTPHPLKLAWRRISSPSTTSSWLPSSYCKWLSLPSSLFGTAIPRSTRIIPLLCPGPAALLRKRRPLSPENCFVFWHITSDSPARPCPKLNTGKANPTHLQTVPLAPLNTFTQTPLPRCKALPFRAHNPFSPFLTLLFPSVHSPPVGNNSSLPPGFSPP